MLYLGFCFAWKTTVAVCISSNDTNTTLHNSTTFSKCSMLPTLIWHFPFCLARLIFVLFVYGGKKRPDQVRLRSDKLIVLKTVASIVPSLSTSLTDDTTTIKLQPINKGKFRRILVFSAPSLCLSLPAIRRLSSVTIPSNRAEVLGDEN